MVTEFLSKTHVFGQEKSPLNHTLFCISSIKRTKHSLLADTYFKQKGILTVWYTTIRHFDTVYFKTTCGRLLWLSTNKNGLNTINSTLIKNVIILKIAFCFSKKRLKELEFHFYDQTFSFLRHKVSILTIKRLRFIDMKFPFLYRNASSSTWKYWLISLILTNGKEYFHIFVSSDNKDAVKRVTGYLNLSEGK